MGYNVDGVSNGASGEMYFCRRCCSVLRVDTDDEPFCHRASRIPLVGADVLPRADGCGYVFPVIARHLIASDLVYFSTFPSPRHGIIRLEEGCHQNSQNVVFGLRLSPQGTNEEG